MIKEAMQYVKELAAPNIQEVNGFRYSDKRLDLVKEPGVCPLTVHTLSAIAEYVNQAPDGEKVGKHMLIHIEGHDSVSLYDELNAYMERRPVLEAKLYDVSPKFGAWNDMETFNIVMQSRFVQNDHSAEILKLIGTISSDEGVTTEDDGVTQKAIVRTGVSLLGRGIVPNPVSLRPFRTFTEAEQPESKFVFRVRKTDKPEAALFEADGGAWRSQAIWNIRRYFIGAIETARHGEVTILA